MILQKIKELVNELQEAGYIEVKKIRKFRVFERPGQAEKYFINRQGDLRRGVSLRESFPAGRFKYKIY